jgi:hypothetical protein
MSRGEAEMSRGWTGVSRGRTAKAGQPAKTGQAAEALRAAKIGRAAEALPAAQTGRAAEALPAAQTGRAAEALPAAQTGRAAEALRAAKAGRAAEAPPAAQTGRAAKAICALLLANLRYWSGVAPRLRKHLICWERAARSIPEPALRGAALAKLHGERFNVEVAATIATISRRAQRNDVLEAIAALQIAYDYLDLLTEEPLDPLAEEPLDPLAEEPSTFAGDSRRLLRRLVAAVDEQAEPSPMPMPPADRRPSTSIAVLPADRRPPRPHAVPPADRRPPRPHAVPPDSHAYLHALIHTVRGAFQRLPSAEPVRLVATHSARRCVEGQLLGHAAMHHDRGEAALERWARAEAVGSPLPWREFAAGASASVLCLHALISAASSPSITSQDAAKLDRLYLSIGALTALDGLVDREQDALARRRSPLARYPDAPALAHGLGAVSRNALAEAQTLPNAAHHAITLAGVVAYYASAPAASDDRAATAVTKHLRAELGPLLLPPLAVMRLWRAAKRLRAHTRIGHARSGRARGVLGSGAGRVGWLNREVEE